MERQVAVKIWLKNLAEGTYVRVGGEWDPNFVQTPEGRKFSRVNVIAVVATDPVPEMSYNNFVIDDGTARVSVRIFEEMKLDIALGDVVMIIGRPREFNQQMYIVPEIIKKIEDKLWVEHRKLELGAPATDLPLVEKVEAEKAINDVEKDELSKSTNIVEKSEKPVNDVEKVIETISKLDSGSGADAEDVIGHSKIQNCEKIIDGLLKEGEIFEISSGKLKVLE